MYYFKYQPVLFQHYIQRNQILYLLMLVYMTQSCFTHWLICSESFAHRANSLSLQDCFGNDHCIQSYFVLVWCLETKCSYETYNLWHIHYQPTPCLCGTKPVYWPEGLGKHLRIIFTQQAGTVLLSSLVRRPKTHKTYCL